MSSEEIRRLYLDFFRSKNHVVIPSASLIPENDPTTLFTGSGMQSMVPYLLGEKHPLGVRITNSQKCFRSQDIDEVGDNRHTTFFEMLGNWSLGNYFKKEQIPWIFEFLTKIIGLNPKNIYVSVFRGNEKLGLSRDEESVKIWQEVFVDIGLEARVVDFSERDGMNGGKIFYYDENKNWWSRSGAPNEMPLGEPGGSASEMFWDFGAELGLHENSEFKNEPCHVNCDCGRFLEIGNNVFMEYVKTENGFSLLSQKNVDFGGGLERLSMALANTPDIFKIDIFQSVMEEMKICYGWDYDLMQENDKKIMRVIADHLRATVFMASDGLVPSNKHRGYVMRRILRRLIFKAYKFGPGFSNLYPLVDEVIKIYKSTYPELGEKAKEIHSVLEEEESRFMATLNNGEKEFNKIISFKKDISAQDAFLLFSTYGFPYELIKELAIGHGINIDVAGFEKEVEKHQELSRTASAGMFKGGLADASEQTIKYHTAAHLMLAALRKVFGENVLQKGSNITSERLRFDFSHPEKMTSEQIKQVEDLVNEKIKQDLPVVCEEMNLDEAKEKGAMGVFNSKYDERVKVYSIDTFSKEICGGPHVNRTSELGNFKIIKEESASAGVRRIKAILDTIKLND